MYLTHLPAILGALGPIFFIMVLGYGLRRGGFPGEAFWPYAEKLTYFLLFPALLVRSLATASLGDYAVVPVAGVVMAALGGMTVLMFWLRPWLTADGPAFSSIYQGGIRFNTYVGLAAASALFGPPGVAMAALAIALLIPLVNVLCVAVITRAVQAHQARPAAMLVSMARNPLILACLMGIALNTSGIGLPPGSAEVLDILARAALPLGLLAVGAGLRLRVAFDRRGLLLAAAGLKLLILPLWVLTLALILGLERLETAILVLFAALPGSPAAYILARQLGGDAELMAAVVTVQTVLSMGTLPLLLMFFVAL